MYNSCNQSYTWTSVLNDKFTCQSDVKKHIKIVDNNKAITSLGKRH